MSYEFSFSITLHSKVLSLTIRLMSPKHVHISMPTPSRFSIVVAHFAWSLYVLNETGGFLNVNDLTFMIWVVQDARRQIENCYRRSFWRSSIILNTFFNLSVTEIRMSMMIVIGYCWEAQNGGRKSGWTVRLNVLSRLKKEVVLGYSKAKSCVNEQLDKQQNCTRISPRIARVKTDWHYLGEGQTLDSCMSDVWRSVRCSSHQFSRVRFIPVHFGQPSNWNTRALTLAAASQHQLLKRKYITRNNERSTTKC